MKKMLLIGLVLLSTACTTTKISPELQTISVPEELMRPMPQELETIDEGN